MDTNQKDVNELQVEANIARKSFSDALAALQQGEAQLLIQQTQVSALRTYVEECRERMRNVIRELTRETEKLQTKSNLMAGLAAGPN